jgi:hypothetical protein
VVWRQHKARSQPRPPYHTDPCGPAGRDRNSVRGGDEFGLRFTTCTVRRRPVPQPRGVPEHFDTRSDGPAIKPSPHAVHGMENAVDGVCRYRRGAPGDSRCHEPRTPCPSVTRLSRDTRSPVRHAMSVARARLLPSNRPSGAMRTQSGLAARVHSEASSRPSDEPCRGAFR